MEEVPTGYEAEGLASDRCSLVLDYPSKVFIGGRGPWTDFSCIISKRSVVHDLVGARQLPDGMDETVNLWWQLWSMADYQYRRSSALLGRVIA